MGLRRACSLLLALVLAAGHAVAQPKRIISVNLCADQYLLALADPDQIVALSNNAHNPDLSFFAEKARAYPLVKGDFEKILTLNADLIITNPFWNAQSRSLIEKFDLPILQFESAQTYAGIKDKTREIAAAIGHPERGEKLIENMDTALDDIARQTATLSHRPTALHYQRRGYLTGQNSLISEIMERGGLRNMADDLHTPYVRRIPLELVLQAQPDFILSNVATGAKNDLGSELLDHPAFTRIYGADRRIYLPEPMTMCDGPAFPAAVTHVFNALHEKRHTPPEG